MKPSGRASSYIMRQDYCTEDHITQPKKIIEH